MSEPWVTISTMAYQQAVKHEHISKKQREELFYFIHDWFRNVCVENEAMENGEETPSEMFNRLTKVFKNES